jgi:type I restriction enzyme S subunit
MTTEHLPSQWKRAALRDCCFRPEYGYTASASQEPVGPKFLRITDIQDGQVEWNKVPYVEKPDNGARSYLLGAGDIVIARIGATTGKAFLIQECPEAVFASYLIRLRTKPGLLPKFLNYCLQTSEYWQHIDSQKGGRLKGGVNIPILENLEIPLPPPIEQRAIARALETVQKAKETRQHELALERERKAALLEYLFTHGTRGEPTKQAEIGEIPESWELVRLGAEFESQLGKMLSQKAHEGNNPKPYMRNANVQWGRVDLTDVFQMDFSEREEKKFRLQFGDLLVCEGGEIGRTAIWKDEIPECYFQKAIHRLRPRSDCVVPMFLLHWMEWAFRFANVYGVAGTQTTIAHLPQEKLEQMKIPKATKEEQEEIVSVLTACDSEIAAIEKQIRLLDELFMAMLEVLMSGHLSASLLIEEHQRQ